MRISDCSSDVCSSDLPLQSQPAPDDVALHFGGAGVDRASKRVAHDTLDFRLHHVTVAAHQLDGVACHLDKLLAHEELGDRRMPACIARCAEGCRRSEEHTSELQSLMRISSAVFCLKKKTKPKNHHYTQKL